MAEEQSESGGAGGAAAAVDPSTTKFLSSQLKKDPPPPANLSPGASRPPKRRRTSVEGGHRGLKFEEGGGVTQRLGGGGGGVRLWESVGGVGVNASGSFRGRSHRRRGGGVLPAAVCIDALRTVHLVGCESFTVSACLTDNMAKGIHLQSLELRVNLLGFHVRMH